MDTAPALHKGADFSHHNGHIDFGTVKADGVEFVAIKATEGAGFVDPDFRDNQRRGRLVGFTHLLFYHFFQPRVDVAMQAMNFAAAVGHLQPGEAVVVDVEAAVKGGVDQWRGLSPEQSCDLVKRFVFHLKTALGLSASQVVLYGSLGWLRGQFGSCLDDLTFMPLWDAHYDVSDPGDPSPWPKILIWQRSEHGTLAGAGAPGTVDMDAWMDRTAWTV